MNHKFKGLAGSPAVCITCHFDVTAHSEFATCDICKKFPCTVEEYMDSLMCTGCLASENEAALLNKQNKPLPEPIARLENEFTSNNGDAKFSVADLPMNGNEFFNAEVESHVALEKRINADNDVTDKQVYYVRQMQLRQQHLQSALAQGIELIKETRSRLAATQRDINLAASKLRKEEREKLKIADISYVPVQAPKKVQARTTEKNKVVINIAQIFCAPRDAKGNFIWNELTDEQREECLVKARLIFANNMSSINTAVAAIDNASKENKQ